MPLSATFPLTVVALALSVIALLQLRQGVDIRVVITAAFLGCIALALALLAEYWERVTQPRLPREIALLLTDQLKANEILRVELVEARLNISLLYGKTPVQALEYALKVYDDDRGFSIGPRGREDRMAARARVSAAWLKALSEHPLEAPGPWMGGAVKQPTTADS